MLGAIVGCGLGTLVSDDVGDVVEVIFCVPFGNFVGESVAVAFAISGDTLGDVAVSVVEEALLE